jgi:hypothetical protein
MSDLNDAVPAVAQEAFLAEATQTVPAAPAETASNFEALPGRAYTEDDLRKVREQEKSKLYPEIDRLKNELAESKKREEERQAEEAARRAEAELLAKKQAESEMDVRQLLEVKEKEWADRLESERVEREKAFALLERERQFTEINEYRNRRLAEEQDNIIPELLDLISGNSVEEIEQSIAGLKDRSGRILDSAQAAMQNARKEMKGTSITTPPSGPLDTNSDNQQFTAEQISSMSVSEYAKYRQKLLGQASSERGKGLFG